MATIIIENGDIVAGANSFVSIEEYRQYFDDIGTKTNSYQDDVVTEQLIAAFRALNSMYSGRLQGLRVSSEQTGPFPRKGMIDFETESVVDSDLIPQNIKYWQIEACQLFLTSGQSVLEPILDHTGSIKAYSSKVDVIEESITFADSGRLNVQVFTRLDALIRPFLKTFLSADMPIVA